MHGWAGVAPGARQNADVRSHRLNLLDPVGLNMALVTDAILAREWEPNGYIEGDGCRIYRYKAME